MSIKYVMMGALLAGVVAAPAAMAEGKKHHEMKAVSSTMTTTEAVVISPSIKASEAESNPRNVERDYQGRSMTLGGTTTGSSLRSGMPTSTKPGGASNP